MDLQAGARASNGAIPPPRPSQDASATVMIAGSGASDPSMRLTELGYNPASATVMVDGEYSPASRPTTQRPSSLAPGPPPADALQRIWEDYLRNPGTLEITVTQVRVLPESDQCRFVNLCLDSMFDPNEQLLGDALECRGLALLREICRTLFPALYKREPSLCTRLVDLPVVLLRSGFHGYSDLLSYLVVLTVFPHFCDELLWGPSFADVWRGLSNQPGIRDVVLNLSSSPQMTSGMRIELLRSAPYLVPKLFEDIKGQIPLVAERTAISATRSRPVYVEVQKSTEPSYQNYQASFDDQYMYVYKLRTEELEADGLDPSEVRQRGEVRKRKYRIDPASGDFICPVSGWRVRVSDGWFWSEKFGRYYPAYLAEDYRGMHILVHPLFEVAMNMEGLLLFDEDLAPLPKHEKDPRTGYFIKPGTPYLIDPTTGMVIDPNTAVEVDPIQHPAYHIDPVSGHLIDTMVDRSPDRSDGRPEYIVDPETGYLRDPDTQLPMIPNYSDRKGRMVDYLTGWIVDRQTGQYVTRDGRLIPRYVVLDDQVLDPLTDEPMEFTTDNAKVNYSLDANQRVIEPQSRLPLDPSTGYVVEPESAYVMSPLEVSSDGYLIDRETQLPVNPATGDVLRADRTEFPVFYPQGSNFRVPKSDFLMRGSDGLVLSPLDETPLLHYEQIAGVDGRLREVETGKLVNVQTGYYVDPSSLNDIMTGNNAQGQTEPIPATFSVEPGFLVHRELHFRVSTSDCRRYDESYNPLDDYTLESGSLLADPTGTVLLNAESGQLTDPTTRRPYPHYGICAESGQHLIHPVTNTPVDISTGLFCDPSTLNPYISYELDPDTGMLIDPYSQRPIDPTTGKQIHLPGEEEEEDEVMQASWPKYTVDRFHHLLNPDGYPINYAGDGELCLPTDDESLLPIHQYTVEGSPSSVIDWATHMPIDWQSGQLRNPDGSLMHYYMVDPNTHLLMNCETGTWYDPSTGSPMFFDRDSGGGWIVCPQYLPVPEHPGWLRNDQTGETLNAETGLPVDAVTGLDVDPSLMGAEPEWIVADPQFLMNPRQKLLLDRQTGEVLTLEHEPMVALEMQGGLPLDPRTGLQISPENGNMYDSVNGVWYRKFSVDDASGYLIDPETQCFISPVDGSLMLTAGRPLHLKYELDINDCVVDPATGRSVNPDTGELGGIAACGVTKQYASVPLMRLELLDDALIMRVPLSETKREGDSLVQVVDGEVVRVQPSALYRPSLMPKIWREFVLGVEDQRRYAEESKEGPTVVSSIIPELLAKKDVYQRLDAIIKMLPTTENLTLSPELLQEVLLSLYNYLSLEGIDMGLVDVETLLERLTAMMSIQEGNIEEYRRQSEDGFQMSSQEEDAASTLLKLKKYVVTVFTQVLKGHQRPVDRSRLRTILSCVGDLIHEEMERPDFLVPHLPKCLRMIAENDPALIPEVLTEEVLQELVQLTAVEKQHSLTRVYLTDNEILDTVHTICRSLATASAGPLEGGAAADDSETAGNEMEPKQADRMIKMIARSALPYVLRVMLQGPVMNQRAMDLILDFIELRAISFDRELIAELIRTNNDLVVTILCDQLLEVSKDKNSPLYGELSDCLVYFLKTIAATDQSIDTDREAAQQKLRTLTRVVYRILKGMDGNEDILFTPVVSSWNDDGLRPSTALEMFMKMMTQPNYSSTSLKLDVANILILFLLRYPSFGKFLMTNKLGMSTYLDYLKTCFMGIYCIALNTDSKSIDFRVLDRVAMIMSLISDKLSYLRILKSVGITPMDTLVSSSGAKSPQKRNYFLLEDILVDHNLGGCVALLGVYLSDFNSFKEFLSKKRSLLARIITVMPYYRSGTALDDEGDDVMLDDTVPQTVERTQVVSRVADESEDEDAVRANNIQGVARLLRFICAEKKFVELLDAAGIPWFATLVHCYKLLGPEDEYSRSWITTTLYKILENPDQFGYLYSMSRKEILELASMDDVFSQTYALRLLNLHYYPPHVSPMEDLLFPEKTGNLFFTFDEAHSGQSEAYMPCYAVLDERKLYGYTSKGGEPLFLLLLNEWTITDASTEHFVLIKLRYRDSPNVLFLRAGDNDFTKQWWDLFTSSEKVVELQEKHFLELLSPALETATLVPSFPQEPANWCIPEDFCPWNLRNDVDALGGVINTPVFPQVQWLVQFSRFLLLAAQDPSVPDAILEQAAAKIVEIVSDHPVSFFVDESAKYAPLFLNSGLPRHYRCPVCYVENSDASCRCIFCDQERDKVRSLSPSSSRSPSKATSSPTSTRYPPLSRPPRRVAP